MHHKPLYANFRPESLSFAVAAGLTCAFASSSVLAQSSVTLSGMVDLGVQYVTNGGGKHVTQVQSGNLQSSKLVIRGQENLGGGMSASFYLDAVIAADTGAGGSTTTNNQSSGLVNSGGLVFNRRSTVSLTGRWGEVRLGRDVVPAYWNSFYFDPFATISLGAGQPFNTLHGSINNVVDVRASNSIGYLLPNIGGVYGQMQYFLGENASNAANSRDGTGYGVRLGYAAGPFDGAISYDRTQYVAGNFRQSNVGASWDFGAVKMMAVVQRDGAGATKSDGWLIGATVPVWGVGQIRASYSTAKLSSGTRPRADKLALGYVHNLSQRTALYVMVAEVSNKNSGTFNVFPGAAGSPDPNQSSSGVVVGMRHSF